MNTIELIDKFKRKAAHMQLNAGLRFLTQYSTQVIRTVFLSGKLFEQFGSPSSVDDVIQRKGFHRRSSHVPLEFMCKWLVAEGILMQVKGGTHPLYVMGQDTPSPGLNELDRHPIAKAFPAGTKLLRLVEQHAEAVFHGQDAGARLYAEETLSDWQEYFSHPGMQFPAHISAHYILNHLPNFERPVRFLEVGAGAASGTRALYELLLEHGQLSRVQTFQVTDLTEGFVAHSRQLIRERYGDLPGFTFRTLDLNASPYEQGFEPGEIDVLLGVNCLHYIRDWDNQLPLLRELLSPTGILISAGYRRKVMNHPFHIELLGSFFEEYWNVVTIPDLRPEFGIMPARNFSDGLRRNGFDHVETWPEPEQWGSELDFSCGVVAGKRTRKLGGTM